MSPEQNCSQQALAAPVYSSVIYLPDAANDGS